MDSRLDRKDREGGKFMSKNIILQAEEMDMGEVLEGARPDVLVSWEK